MKKKYFIVGLTLLLCQHSKAQSSDIGFGYLRLGTVDTLVRKLRIKTVMIFMNRDQEATRPFCISHFNPNGQLTHYIQYDYESKQKKYEERFKYDSLFRLKSIVAQMYPNHWDYHNYGAIYDEMMDFVRKEKLPLAPDSSMYFKINYFHDVHHTPIGGVRSYWDGHVKDTIQVSYTFATVDFAVSYHGGKVLLYYDEKVMRRDTALAQNGNRIVTFTHNLYGFQRILTFLPQKNQQWLLSSYESPETITRFTYDSANQVKVREDWYKSNLLIARYTHFYEQGTMIYRLADDKETGKGLTKQTFEYHPNQKLAKINSFMPLSDCLETVEIVDEKGLLQYQIQYHRDLNYDHDFYQYRYDKF
jgi:hypothetical protein